MIFSEIYGAYYRTVSGILSAAVSGELTDDKLRNIIEKYAFSESMLSIEPALKNGKWPLIRPDGKPVIRNAPSFPVTELQKRWLKAVSLDPRIKLFDCSFDIPEDTEPLFTPDDICVFDKYADGDNYEDEEYIRNFRTVLKAVKEKKKLRIENLNSRGNRTFLIVIPKYLEYSEKDDKFRVQTGTERKPVFINLSRIVSCEIYEGKAGVSEPPVKRTPCSLTIELTDERNALERVLLHFSHFEKEAVKTGDNTYSVSIRYDKSDETELVIRVLSFGPFIKVTEPDEFAELIKERLRMQRNCGF